LGANVLFTLASVPLALHFLSKEEFGLWALTSQIAGYIALVDFGLSAAASRVLIDFKDHADRSQYGGMVQTGALVGLSQAILVFVVGVGTAFIIGPVLDVPRSLRQELFWLIVGQSGITAVMFAARIVAHVLTSHQRFDVNNLSGAVSFGVNLATTWWGFAHHLGVYSMLLGQACGIVFTTAANFWGCLRLRLLPRRGEWGRPTWQNFRALSSFGLDVFLVLVGNQFINASQTILLTRLIGLDAAAVWNVCTRGFVLLVQVIARIFDYSTAALAEMMVRGEREILRRRFRELATLAVNLSVAGGVMYASCNTPFVRVWTSGRMDWPAWNDVLLAVFLVINIAVRLHTGLVGQTKVFGFLRFVYFFEGLTFIGLTILLHRFGGITIMLVISILCSLCFSFSYGLRRTCQYFGLTWRELAGWHVSTARLAASVTPVAVVVWILAASLPPVPRLAVEVVVMGLWTSLMFLRYGIGTALRADLSRFAPAWARVWL
jgi:O-antigen/teichoic acid export membrane protein